jgi:hypothetical protein
VYLVFPVPSLIRTVVEAANPLPPFVIFGGTPAVIGALIGEQLRFGIVITPSSLRTV